MTPAHSNLIIANWSCLTNLGRVFDFSPDFLSTRQIKACKSKKYNVKIALKILLHISISC